MNIYEILVVCENKTLGKGYYTSFEISSKDLESAKKLAILESNQEGFIAQIDEFEILSENQPLSEEKIIKSIGRAYFDC